MRSSTRCRLVIGNETVRRREKGRWQKSFMEAPAARPFQAKPQRLKASLGRDGQGNRPACATCGRWNKGEINQRFLPLANRRVMALVPITFSCSCATISSSSKLSTCPTRQIPAAFTRISTVMLRRFTCAATRQAPNTHATVSDGNHRESAQKPPHNMYDPLYGRAQVENIARPPNGDTTSIASTWRGS